MKYAVYIACPQDGNAFYGYTHDISIDISFYKNKNIKLFALTKYIPINYAYYIYNQINNPSLIDRFIFNKKDKIDFIEKKVNKLLKILDVKTGEPIVTDDKCNIYKIDDYRLYNLIKGKAYLADEIKYLIDYDEKRLYDMLQIYKLKGLLNILPAVELKEEGIYKCLRCGSNNVSKFKCFSCMEMCAYCEDCLNMGRTTACKVYIECPDTKDNKSYRDVKLNMDFCLTDAQLDASNEAVKFVSGTKKKALIWAACGAGKTEVVFEAIRKALSWGNKVLYAVPRRDVVIELGERFKKAFPDEQISILYGGSERIYSNFTIATTHQTLRFYKTFDLTIIDEYDAFPYNGSDMLERAVKRAMKDDGRIIYMTATPTKKMYIDYLDKAIDGITIPARHHHHPLPVPEIMKLNLNENDLKLPKKISDIIKKFIKESKKTIIFVPYIATAPKICSMLRNDNIKADYIHSKDPKRDTKKAKLIRGDIDVLVSTTVMERGITIENIQVLILFADNNIIFDERTLIQMAGRVGRTTKYYEGSVIYVSKTISDEMESSINKIRLMNKIAKEKKYIF